jgi:hypothetical protein
LETNIKIPWKPVFKTPWRPLKRIPWKPMIEFLGNKH